MGFVKNNDTKKKNYQYIYILFSLKETNKNYFFVIEY